MHPPRRLLALGASVVVTAALAQVVPGTGADAAPAPSTATKPSHDKTTNPKLGNGLARLVDGSSRTGVGPGHLKIDQSSLTIRDKAGRVMVNLTPSAGTDRAAFKRQVADLGFKLTSVDVGGSGTLEGFIDLSKVERIAGLAGTGTINQTLRPITHAGDTTSQGVAFQRVDKVLKKGVDGAGITVGVLSDSYDTATDAITGGPIATRASDDVASGDLPGVGNPDGDVQPVVVIEEFNGDPASSADEGRAMLQIVHDVAPAAKLCFASAFNGDVGFANNIRALADKNGPCAADVIVDDVSYFNEPFFSDGVISAAVDDVTGDGASYYSSAGNAGDQNAWRSPVSLVPANEVGAAAKAAGLDLTGVDPALYAGGLQDMNTRSGVDVAQTLALGDGGGLFDLQWNDPVDADGAEVGDPYFSDSGTLTAPDQADEYTFTATREMVGQQVLFRTDGAPTGSVDLILDVTTPDGTELGPVDTGGSPEVLPYKLDQAGDYTITISGFDGATGPYTVDVSPITAPATTTTDFNLLVFDEDGNFVAPLGSDNTLTGQPNEVANLPDFAPKAQIVIAKATPGETPVTEIGYINNGGIYTEEYFDPLAPATFGHSTAAGANGVAAIDPFKPYIQEYYTSPGGGLKFYFDRNGQRFAGGPQTRNKPDISSTDRGNTTFFVADDLRDADAFPNFGGTSAAAPHAAGIAALVLDGAGGPGSLTPQHLAYRLKRSTFKHDLDPFFAKGHKKGLTITVQGPPGDERDASPASMDDPNFFHIRYHGKKALKKIVFHGRDAQPTSTRRSGLVFDTRALATPGNYRDGGYPFTIGRIGGGLKIWNVNASLRYKLPGEYRIAHNLEISFPKRFKAGNSLNFGIDRDLRLPGLADHPVEGNGADEIGGGVLIPQNKAIRGGLTFTAVRVDGKRIHGVIKNDLGSGFTALDGYGVVDAYDAVFR